MSGPWWFDMIVAEEEARANRLGRMTDAQWKQEAKNIIATWRGDLRDCLNTLDRMEAEREKAKAATVPSPHVRTEWERDFALWRDMVDEPEKYGDDIVEWLELDAKLRAQSGHWRLNAYWFEKDAEVEAKQAEEARETAATRIQALVRGHQSRNGSMFRDCCMCLAHRICPLKTDVGMMCRACAEDGPHADLTGCADPWDWFRSDYTDLAPVPVLTESDDSESDDSESDADSEAPPEKDYTPEPRGVRNRLHEFPHNRHYECEWEEDDKGTCLWCGTMFRRPYSGVWKSGPNELGFCSNECDRNRYCWKRMKWAGKKGPLDHEWLATCG